jgi:hypothetical protein
MEKTRVESVGRLAPVSVVFSVPLASVIERTDIALRSDGLTDQLAVFDEDLV